MSRQPYNHELRLERALQHLQSLHAEIERWLAGNPYRTVQEFDAQRGEHVIRVEVLGDPLDTFGPIIGDCLHNLRSALGNLAYDLALAYTGDPLPPRIAENSEFPIFGDRPMRADEQSRKIGGIHPDAQAIIDGLQPYHRGDDFASDLLWHIHELSRIDKHRLPHLTVSAFGGFGIRAADAPRIELESVTMRQPGPVESGAEVASFRAVDPSDEVDVDLGFAFDVAFAQGSPAYGQIVAPWLAGLRGYIIDYVVPPLAIYLD